MGTNRQLILGISAYYHDSAACLLKDGEIVAAAQEERFTRKKGDASYPEHAVAYCLKLAPALGRDKVIIVNLSGRGDKDVMQVAKIKGVEL